MTHIRQKSGFQFIGLLGTASCLFKFTYHMLPFGNIIHTDYDTVNIPLFVEYRSSKYFDDVLIIEIE